MSAGEAALEACEALAAVWAARPADLGTLCAAVAVNPLAAHGVEPPLGAAVTAPRLEVPA
jgi:hypothetical protein